MYNIANFTKPLQPQETNFLIDDIRGVVVAKRYGDLAFADLLYVA